REERECSALCDYRTLRPDRPLGGGPALAEEKLPCVEGISNRSAFRPQCSGQRFQNRCRLCPQLDGRFHSGHGRQFRSQNARTTCRCIQIVLSYTRPTIVMTRQQVLDLYFMDARSKLIDLAAFLDRLDRADGEPDFRLAGFRKALVELDKNQP